MIILLMVGLCRCCFFAVEQPRSSIMQDFILFKGFRRWIWLLQFQSGMRGPLDGSFYRFYGCTRSSHVLNPVGIPRVKLSFYCHRTAHATWVGCFNHTVLVWGMADSAPSWSQISKSLGLAWGLPIASTSVPVPWLLTPGGALAVLDACSVLNWFAMY